MLTVTLSDFFRTRQNRSPTLPVSFSLRAVICKPCQLPAPPRCLFDPSTVNSHITVIDGLSFLRVHALRARVTLGSPLCGAPLVHTHTLCCTHSIQVFYRSKPDGVSVNRLVGGERPVRTFAIICLMLDTRYIDDVAYRLLTMPFKRV